MKKDAATKYPNSANLFQFCRRVLDHKFGGIRVIDQDVGQILGFDPADCYAYSDSSNDLPLLTAVGTPVVVNPDRGLEQHARSEGWRVLTLDPASIRAERKRVRAASRPI